MSYTIQKAPIRGFEVLCDGVVIGWCLVPWQARKVIADHVKANSIDWRYGVQYVSVPRQSNPIGE